jgi:hypothetical protein
MSSPFRLSLAFVAAAFLSACGDDGIQVYDIPKEGHAASEDPHALPAAADAAMPAESPDLHWDAPAGWTEQPAGGMRAASYRTPGGADMSVVVLPGDAGGPLANVNRWRGQIGLGPLDETAFRAQSRRVPTKVGDALYTDFAHGGTRMLAAILPSAGRSWFFKLTGPEAEVAKAAAGFEALVGGVHQAHR